MIEITVRSYLSFPTDLAGEMREWPEFITGEGYYVDLQDESTGGKITVRYNERQNDARVIITGPASSRLYDQVVGRVVCAMALNSDELMVGRH